LLNKTKILAATAAYLFYGGSFTIVMLVSKMSNYQGSCGSLKVLEFFPDFQGLESP